jgi:hypothetical protein
MGFRDDFEALSTRAEALERDLAKTRDELTGAQARVADGETEIDRLRGRLRAAGIEDEPPPRRAPRASDRNIGIAAIVLAIVKLGWLGSLCVEWTGYVEGDHTRLAMLDRSAYADLVTYFDAAEIAVLASMSVVLCIIGVGLVRGQVWAAVASLLWATVALVVNVFTALAIDAIFGKFERETITGAVISTIFPLVMLVYGIVAVRRLTKISATTEQRGHVEDRSPS